MLTQFVNSVSQVGGGASCWLLLATRVAKVSVDYESDFHVRGVLRGNKFVYANEGFKKRAVDWVSLVRA